MASGPYSDVAAAIEALSKRNRSGTLKIWGEWFGRPLDNVHVCNSCEAEEDYITLYFDNKERLGVWQPGTVTSRGYTLIIETAKKVRWEWYYYGRPQLPENLMFIEYERTGNAVSIMSNWRHGTTTTAKIEENAIEIVGL